MIWYEYLVGYGANGATGRMFLQRNAPIDSAKAVMEIEDDLKRDTGKTAIVMNFTLLRTFEQDDTTTNDERTS